MKLAFILPVAAVAILATSGCATSGGDQARTAQQDIPQVIIPAVTTRPVAATAGTLPGQVYPGQPAPIAQQPANRGVAVYTAPKIVQTVLAPYEDEKGRLFGPQVMYEKVEEGRFNAEALQNPELAYIPQENMVVPAGMGNPASAVAMQRKAEEAQRMPTDLIDPRDVIVTGLLGKETNRSEAERMAAAAGRRAVYDPDIGWILVPISGVR